MQQLPNSPIRIQLGVRGWAAVAIALLILAAAVVAITFLAIGVFVIAVPLMLLAPILFYFRPKAKSVLDATGNAAKEAAANGTTIDSTYRVSTDPPEV